MFKFYYFLLVLVLGFQQLISVSEKEYYQYVINKDAPLPCVATEDCNDDNNDKLDDLDANYNVEEEQDDEDLDEDVLYEEVEVVPYDALNDALQEVNVQRNLFKPRKTRSSGSYSRNVYRDVEETHRKYMNEKFPRDDKLSETGCLTRESSYHYHPKKTNEIPETEFYSNGLTRNDLLERKKLELIRHTFADEKMKLLQTDKFIHQIITSLGELENYEFESKEDSDDQQGSLDQPSITGTSREDDQEDKDDSRISSDMISQPEKNGHNNNGHKETIKEIHDFDGMGETTKQTSDYPEEINTDFEDFVPDELTNVYSESNNPVENEEGNDEEQGSVLGKMSLPEGIIDEPKVEEVLKSDDKFVISKSQYESYLRSSVKPRSNSDDSLDSDQPNVYSIKTKTTKSKRKANEDLHDFEIPRFEDIPKVHELPNQHVEKLWNEFKKKYKKRYSRKSIETKKRQHWAANLHRIHQHNEEARRGLHSYSLRDNHLTDLHPRHYLKEMTRLTHSRIRRNIPNLLRSSKSNDSVLIPDHLDWRDKGFLTPDWNQEDCGACYAFSIASAIQGQLFKQTSEMEDLSIQQVVDCSIISGNLGCAGGSLRNTLNYVQFAGGLMKAEDYPYKGKQSICKFKKPAVAVDVSSWSVLPPQDEHALKVTLATIGPLAVSINASPHTFQLYSSGIYNDDACTSDYVNHAMLLVGYTKNSWILKNWWSENWGDKGYMYLKRGHNRCGIANYAVYALI